MLSRLRGWRRWWRRLRPLGDAPAGREVWLATRRLVVALIGATIVGLGLVMVVAPGPALIVVPLGLFVLGFEFVWALRLQRRLVATAAGAADAARRWRLPRISGTPDAEIPRNGRPPDRPPLRSVPTMRYATGRLLVAGRRVSPVKVLFLGYLSYVLLGWGLLCIPAAQAPGPDGGGVGVLDNLFIATSAMSTTGLVTVNTPLAYSFWGELVVLLLIQAGGIGYMTFGSFIVLAARTGMSKWREGMARSAFTLPEGFQAGAFVRNVVIFTLLVEAVGAALLFWAFSAAGVGERAIAGGIGASGVGVAHVAWQSIFHSVSAFCTAGFSLFPDSLEAYPTNPWINGIISALALFGAIGFIVMSDVFWRATGRRPHLTFTTRIILVFTGWIVVGGAVLLFIADPAIAALPGEERVLVAWFQSMTAATTVGFNTYPIGRLGQATVLLMVLLMVIGASPSGTGGGLKSTSLSAIIATLKSTIRGRHTVTFFGARIPLDRLHTAFAALAMYASVLLIGGYLLLLTETRPLAAGALGGTPWAFEDLLFEAASALGTVGLSRGVTGDLTDLGKLVVIALMFIGRLSPLTFGLALFGPGAGDHPAPDAPEAAVADVAV
ncbi:potassium transporter TrkG [Phycisphaera mikurensis]|uniref:Cation transporter n=1 Tax=Phycisphaera mikurensis (strain NBRC 102666 / KCTC 22515 / FYK2301M01) TaxID=1142394 RepID=I0II27_PHYMF|nr:potassium transporter TrkG [Phycisphaera mikurensis]BAM04915.1 cation transporter [Phycisphaera mikurensis NBRC 102666]